MRKPSNLSSNTQPESSNGASVSVASIGCRRRGRVDFRAMVGSFYTAGRGRNEEDGPPGPNHAQHPGFERGDRFRRREHLSLKAGPEAVDEDTGRPETRQLDDGSGTQLDEGAERHPLQVQTSRCDIRT